MEEMEGDWGRAARVAGQHLRVMEAPRRAAASFGQTVGRSDSWIRSVSAALHAEG